CTAACPICGVNCGVVSCGVVRCGPHAPGGVNTGWHMICCMFRLQITGFVGQLKCVQTTGCCVGHPTCVQTATKVGRRSHRIGPVGQSGKCVGGGGQPGVHSAGGVIGHCGGSVMWHCGGIVQCCVSGGGQMKQCVCGVGWHRWVQTGGSVCGPHSAQRVTAVGVGCICGGTAAAAAIACGCAWGAGSALPGLICALLFTQI